MNPPTFVAEYPTASYSTNASSKTASVTTQPGDLVVVYAGSEWQSALDITSISGNGISFTLHQAYTAAGNFGAARIWSGVDSTGGTGWTLTANANGSSNQWGFTCLVFRDSDGAGASNKANAASAAPSLNLTTTEDNSAIVVFNTDWNALNTARTWRTVNGVTPSVGNGLETTYEATGAYTAYGAYYDDVGTAGSKTVGLSAPGSQNYAIVALEVKGSEAPEPPSDTVVTWLNVPTTPALRATSKNSVASTNSLGLTIPPETQPGEFMILIVAQTSFNATLFNAISGWTKQGEQRAAGAAHTIAVFTRIAQVGDAGTTVTSTSVNSENYTGQLRVYYAANGTLPLDTAVVFAEQDPAATTASAPAVTVTTDNAALITAYSIPTTSGVVLADGDWTAPTGFGNEITSCTSTGTNNAALATYDQSAVAAGVQGPFSATATDSRRWAMATVAVRVDSAPLLYDTFSIAGTYSPQWSTQPGSISAGTLHMTTDAAYSQRLTSAQTFDLTNRSITVQAPVVPAAASGEAWLEFGPDTVNNRIMIGKGGSTLVLRLVNSGVMDDHYVTYNATDHLWWRIKLTGSLLEWQTSPDGTTWTTLRSMASGYPNLTAATAHLFVGHYVGGDPDEPVEFDNISLV